MLANYNINSGNFLYDAENANSVLGGHLEGWGGVGGKKVVQEGGDVFIREANKCRYTAETNTLLYIN